MSDAEVREKALTALDDMWTNFGTDYPHVSRKKYMPGAIGARIVRLSDPEQGYEMYYHSSMKQNKAGSYADKEIHLEENFKSCMTRDGGTLPAHRRNYRCIEPDLFTNSDARHLGSGTGSRIYLTRMASSCHHAAVRMTKVYKKPDANISSTHLKPKRWQMVQVASRLQARHTTSGTIQRKLRGVLLAK